MGRRIRGCGRLDVAVTCSMMWFRPSSHDANECTGECQWCLEHFFVAGLLGLIPGSVPVAEEVGVDVDRGVLRGVAGSAAACRPGRRDVRSGSAPTVGGSPATGAGSAGGRSLGGVDCGGRCVGGRGGPDDVGGAPGGCGGGRRWCGRRWGWRGGCPRSRPGWSRSSRPTGGGRSMVPARSRPGSRPRGASRTGRRRGWWGWGGRSGTTCRPPRRRGVAGTVPLEAAQAMAAAANTDQRRAAMAAPADQCGEDFLLEYARRVAGRPVPGADPPVGSARGPGRGRPRVHAKPSTGSS